jgi:hypothetical protein
MGYSFSQSGFKQAQTYDQGKYLDPGQYKAEIVKTLVKDSRGSGTLFIAELRILESNHAEHSPGSKRSWVQKMQDKDIAFPAIKEFAMAVMGVSKNDTAAVSEFNEQCETLLDAAINENLFEGYTVAIECFHKETKKGNTFTVHQWYPWSVEEAAS